LLSKIQILQIILDFFSKSVPSLRMFLSFTSQNKKAAKHSRLLEAKFDITIYKSREEDC